MPPNKRSRPGEGYRLRNAVLLAALALLPFGCGEGEAQSAAIEIERAVWRGEKVFVEGGWARGVSTPPTCRMLEGRDGPTSTYFEPDARVSLNGNTFSKEFIPAGSGREPLPSTAREDLYVRCSVSLDSGRTAEDLVRVSKNS